MRKYFVYDGKWNIDGDKAIVHAVCDTIGEAVRYLGSYGCDEVIVSYLDDGSVMTDERLEVDSFGIAYTEEARQAKAALT